jgi:hypothetical protein
METNCISNFNTKYAELITEKNFYRLLLNVKTELRKLAKKSDVKTFFELILWCAKILNENKEDESCITLYLYAIEEYEKIFNRSDSELCLDYLKAVFLVLPENYDKSKIKHKLLMFFESKHIYDITLQLHGFYKIFADDSLKNKDVLDGLRYALKSQDYLTLINYIECLINEKLKNDLEKKFFISRVCLELILLKNLTLAFQFISKYTDTNDNLQNNHPIINFSYLLIALISRDTNSSFQNFWAFINIYKPLLFIDQHFAKYLNKISLLYYNESILEESGMNNLMNMLRAFSG